MWQRVQTLYLAVATALIAFLFTCNKAVVIGPDGSEVEAYRYTAYIPYLILLLITTALNVLALTTYTHRVFQMRTSVLSAIITVALQAWLVVDFISNHNAMVFKVTVLFPLISIIFHIMAIRGIVADELLVQSMGRLRSRKRREAKKRK